MRWSLCALGFSVSFGVALVSISKLLIVLGFVLMARRDWHAFSQTAQDPLQWTQNRWQLFKRGLNQLGQHFKNLDTPWVVLVCVMWMTLSLLWTQADDSEWPRALIRHSRILFIPIILYCIRSKEDVLWIVRSMVLGQLVIVVCSYLLWLGFPLPFFNPLYPKDFGVVINGHLEQPIMTTLMVVMVWNFRQTLWPKIGLGFFYFICALGAFNVFFIMTGRTGFIAMLLAITFGLYQHLKARYNKHMTWVWLLPIIMACALSLLSSRFNQKVFEAVNDIALYSQGNDATSQGYRLDYWRQSIKSISESLWVGHGVGSWRHEYISHGGNEPNAPTNPHQQFLLWTVEAGLLGLALIIGFYRALYKDAKRLQGPAKEVMLSCFGIVLMVSLFNCPFYGAGIGEFFILIFASMSALARPKERADPSTKSAALNSVELTWIEHLGRRVVTQPLSTRVLGNEESYASTEGLSKLGWRQLRKNCYLSLHSQGHLLCHEANPLWVKGLWIYQRTSQIGDSLMDLAPRGLFKSNGIEMDLMTPEHLAELFAGDPYFKRIFSTPTKEDAKHYDFVVVQSIHHRSLYKKIKYFKDLPWVCIQGNYDVPDFTRSRFATQRLCDLFKWTLSDEAFQQQARQKLFPLPSIHPSTLSKKYPLAIVLGGMDPSRIYLQWPELLNALQTQGFERCLLLGTGESARITSEAICKTFNQGLKIENMVNAMTLKECQIALSQTELLITADGGLMHLGVASGCKRIISLFTKGILPEYRLPMPELMDAIQSQTDAINDIAYGEIIKKINRVI
jgi:hypothetical protein